jgi:plasmid stabilization system protein ParE
MPQAEWTPTARKDLDEIHDFIGVEQRSQTAAEKLVRDTQQKAGLYATQSRMVAVPPPTISLGYWGLREQNCPTLRLHRWVMAYVYLVAPGPGGGAARRGCARRTGLPTRPAVRCGGRVLTRSDGFGDPSYLGCGLAALRNNHGLAEHRRSGTDFKVLFSEQKQCRPSQPSSCCLPWV